MKISKMSSSGNIMGSGFHLLHRQFKKYILLYVCNVGKIFIKNDMIHIAMTNKLHRITLANNILLLVLIFLPCLGSSTSENSFLSEPNLVLCRLPLLPAVSSLPEG